MADSSSLLASFEGESYDEVEEFVWEDDEDERVSEVCDLVRSGNRAFQAIVYENSWQHGISSTKLLLEAISCYSKAQKLKPGDSVILSNKSISFCRISQLLRERSASDSEYQPLSGLDPTAHAELSLKDAEKVLNIRSNSPKSHFLKAKALILLERYEDAREALLSGLLVDPLNRVLQKNLMCLDSVISDSLKQSTNRRLQRIDDLDCTLCLKLLHAPVTTPCGHSFCRSCLLQAMDHGNRCPICRTVLFISPRTYPISITLNNIIQKSFPEEYAERKSEHESFTHSGINLMPLFVMDVVLPCQKLSLNIYEPRYKLMVRRIMEGNHRMGVVIVDSATGTIADVACEVEIVECEPLPDGRFCIEIEGRRRFHIIESWDQDGYRVANVEWIEDVQRPEGSQEREELKQVVNGAAELARNWLTNSSDGVWIGRRYRRFERLSDAMPGTEDAEKFSFWFVDLLSLRPSQRLELLRLRDARERINRALSLLGAAEEGCIIQ